MVKDEARWSMVRFCGPLNVTLKSLDFTVFTVLKAMEVCKPKKQTNKKQKKVMI